MKGINSGSFRLLAVGDIFLDRPEPLTSLQSLRNLLESADILFGNNEGVYSDSIDRAPNARQGPQVAEVANAEALGRLGFDVMSLANNHIVDGGHAGLHQTMELLTKQGIRTAGAGRNLAEALRPAVLEVNGTRVGFLAFSSVFPGGYEARVGVPGLAPFRSHTFYVDPNPDYWNPGTPPQIIVAIDDADSAAVEEAVQAAKEVTDILVASMHWGDHLQPYALTDHEPQAAQLLVNAGVDLILGHHQHMLRGVGFFGQVPVMYGLGHIACDLPRLAEGLRQEFVEIGSGSETECRRVLGEFGIYPREDYPLLPFHPDARRTVVARFDVADHQITSMGLYPCRIQPTGEVEPLAADDPRAEEELAYFLACQKLVPQATEVLVEADMGLTYWRLTKPATAVRD